MSNDQTLALQLADAIEEARDMWSVRDAAAELRRQHAEIEELRDDLADYRHLHTRHNALAASAREYRDEIARLTAALDDAHAGESVAQAAAEALRADAERWREMRRVFHVTEHIGRTTGMPATKLSAHWHGWASGDHADVTGCVDALINERPVIDAAREAQR